MARSLRDLFIRRLRREIPVSARVHIETTGLADPAPVLYALLEDFFIVRAQAQDIVSQAFAMFCGVSALPCSR